MPRMIASYSNPFGKSKKAEQNLKFRSTIRLVGRDGSVKGERCPKCSGFAFKIGKGIVVNLQKKFEHKKGCELS